MEMITEFLDACGSAIVAGLFGIVLWWLKKADDDRKENRKQSDERMDKIEANTEQTQANAAAIREISEHIEGLKATAAANRESSKVSLRYMLQRYHGEFMLQGYIHSHQKDEFLELLEVYKSIGGNGTAAGWAEEVKALPVRDDLPIANPYLEILKQGRP